MNNLLRLGIISRIISESPHPNLTVDQLRIHRRKQRILRELNVYRIPAKRGQWRDL